MNDEVNRDLISRRRNTKNEARRKVVSREVLCMGRNIRQTHQNQQFYNDKWIEHQPISLLTNPKSLLASSSNAPKSNSTVSSLAILLL